jgi:hypothetical protein
MSTVTKNDGMVVVVTADSTDLFSVTGRYVISRIQADCVGTLYRGTGTDKSQLWKSTAVGDTINFPNGLMVDGLCSTGAADAWQIWLR